MRVHFAVDEEGLRAIKSARLVWFKGRVVSFQVLQTDRSLAEVLNKSRTCVMLGVAGTARGASGVQAAHVPFGVNFVLV